MATVVGYAVVCNPPALSQDLLRVDRADRYALQSRGGVFGMQELQEKVQDKVGLAPSQQRLTHASKQISDYPNRTLAEFNIQAEATLHLSGRLRGD
jgi:Ubiquitin family